MNELGDAVGNLSTGFGGLGKKVPGVGGKFGKFGSLLGGLVSRFGSLGNVSKVGAIGKLTIPLTIITTVLR